MGCKLSCIARAPAAAAHVTAEIPATSTHVQASAVAAAPAEPEQPVDPDGNSERAASAPPLASAVLHGILSTQLNNSHHMSVR